MIGGLPADGPPVVNPSAVLEAIFVAPKAGAQMRSLPEAEITPDGIAGDRYALRTGYFSRGSPSHVTLIATEALEEMERQHGVQVRHGEHRRNLVTRGVELAKLFGCRLGIGASVVLEYDKPRPPCGYLERVAGKGMTRALGEGAGIGMRVITPGIIRVGDRISLLSAPPASRVRRLP